MNIIKQHILSSTLYFIVLLMCFTLPEATAQVQVYPVSVTTQISPPYSVNLTDYAAPGSEQMKVIILQRDLTQPQYRLYLKMQIELNGRIIVRTSPSYVPPAFVLEPGIPTLISGSSLSPYFDPANMEFTGYSRDQYIRTKLFPEGAYVITFTAFDWTRRDVALSNGGAFYCYLAKTDPPILNLPINNALVQYSSPQYINFQWLSRNVSSPNSAFSTRYRFELFEMRVGGISPSEVVTRTRPVFTAESDRTNLVYSIAEPVLEKGMRYVWRVKAFDTQGKDYIRNNGFSEVFSFVYGEGETGVVDFSAVGNFKAQAVSPRKAKLSWDVSSAYDSYRIYYRKQGNENKWYESETIQNSTEINGLTPGSIYECKVQGKRGNAWGSFSIADTVGMPVLPVIECGSPFTPLVVTNREPLLELMRLQEFDAGGFMVTVADPYALTTSPGRFTGKGFVQVPLFGHKKIRCEFTNIFINTDFRMVEGSIRLITDNTDGKNALWNIDEVFEGGTDNGTVIEGTEEVSLVIPDIVITEAGSLFLDTASEEIFVLDELNDTTIRIDVSIKLRENPGTLTVQDSGGNIYSIDTKTGKATTLGKVPPTGGMQQTAILPSTVDTRKGKVIFEAVKGRTRFAFDARSVQYARSNIFNEEYKTLKTADGDLYDIPNKLIPVGETDVVLARAELKSKSIEPDSIVFRSGTGTVYKAESSGREGEYLLTLPSGMDNDGIEVFATYTDKKGQVFVLGKLIVLSYSVKRPALTLVPVNGNGTDIDPAAVKEELDKVYLPVAVDWQVKLAGNFETTIDSLDIEGSGMFSMYTEGMKKLNNDFLISEESSFDPSSVYLFLLQYSDNKLATGDMPRGRQFGYVFTRTAGSAEAVYRTIAHEIAHGSFSLSHTFDGKYDIAQGTTSNLLDYTAGTDLVKHQWDAIHNPGLVIGMFERDEEGMMNTDDLNRLLRILKYSGTNSFVFGIKCSAMTIQSDGMVFKIKGESYHVFFMKYSYVGEEIQISSYDFDESSIPTNLNVEGIEIPANLDKFILLNQMNEGKVVSHLCTYLKEEYSKTCETGSLKDVDNLYKKFGSDIMQCFGTMELSAGGYTLPKIAEILTQLQSEARNNQQIEFTQNGQLYRLNAQSQAQAIENPESDIDINAGNWSDESIDMKMRIGFNADGVLQFAALGIRKDLPLAAGKTASLMEISANMLTKNNALLKEYQVKNIFATLDDFGINLDSDEFPDGKKVEINNNSSFIKILCEAGGIGILFLKTAEIEQPVYLESETNTTIKAPPIATGTLEAGAMSVTDITSMVATIHDLVTDKQARRDALEGFNSIKVQVANDPSLLFPILGEIILQETTGSGKDSFKEMLSRETDEGRKNHLVTKTSVRTAVSVFASGKFLTKLPDMAILMAAKIPKAKLLLKLRNINEVLSADLLKILDNFPDKGNKFLDEFVEATDETLEKFLKQPELLDAWRKMDELGADVVLRKNQDALEALNKPKFERPDPADYLDKNYINHHLDMFKEGVVKFAPNAPSGAIGPPTQGTFVIPKSQATALVKESGGDIKKLEKLLGLDEGFLGTNPVRIDVENPSGLRMPSGNEFGANEKWIPGGRTSGGVNEATVDQIQPGSYSVKNVFE